MSILSTKCPTCYKIFALCNNCGNSVRDVEDRFCPHCGKPYKVG